jgi:hypothetical protein
MPRDIFKKLDDMSGEPPVDPLAVQESVEALEELAEAQRDSIEIAEQFAAAKERVSESVSKMGSAHAKNITPVDKMTQAMMRSVKVSGGVVQVSKKVAAAVDFINESLRQSHDSSAEAASGFEQATEALSDAIDKTSESESQASDQTREYGASVDEARGKCEEATGAQEDFKEAVDDSTDSQREASREAERYAVVADGEAEAVGRAADAQKKKNDANEQETESERKKRVETELWVGVAEVTKEAYEELTEAEQDLIDERWRAFKASEDYKKAMKGQITVMEALASRSQAMQKEINEQASLFTVVKDKLKEGTEEADRFNNGMGQNATGMLAAGLAAAFLAQKLADLIDKYKDTAISFAKFRVEQANLARTTLIAPEGPEQLERMRSQLKLTTGQFTEFTKVLQQGVHAGVASVDQLVTAGKNLQQVFGGDQTERFREYVELLEKIPSLDTDLSITASMDDRADAWFALAQEGKVAQVIELQAAGLAGGLEVEAPEGDIGKDVELLNAEQATQHAVEDISQMAHKWFPTWGPQLGAIASGALKAGTIVAGAIVGVRAFMVLTGRAVSRGQKEMIAGQAQQLNAQRATTAAIKRFAYTNTKGFGEQNEINRDILRKAPKGRIFKHFFRELKRGNIKGAVKRTAKRAVLKFGGKKMARRLFARGAARTAAKYAVGTAAGAGATKAAVGVAAKGVAGEAAKRTAATVAAKGGAKVAAGVAKGALGVGSKLVAGGAKALTNPLVAAGAIVGTAANMLGDSMIEAGHKVSGGAVKTSGALAETAATIGGFALVGSAFGPIGTGVGAVVGGLVALATSLPDVADGIDSMGEELESTIDGQKKYNWAVRTGFKIFKYTSPSYWLGKVGKGFQKGLAATGKAIKNFGRDVWGGVKIMGGWVKTGFQYLTLSKAGIQQMEKEKAIAERVQKAQEQYAHETIRLRAILMSRQKREQASALVFQKSMKRIEDVANTAAVKLNAFREKLAGMRIDVGANVGGNFSQFNASLDIAGAAASGTLQKLGEGFDRERTNILRDTDLNAKMRQRLLMMLHHAEMEAVLQFAQNMEALVGQFDKIPSVVVNSLKSQMAKMKLDVRVDAGAASAEEMVGSIVGDIERSFDTLTTTLDAASRDYARVTETTNIISQRNDELKKSVMASIKDMPEGDEFRKKLEGMLTIEGGEIVDIDTRAVSAELAKLEMSISRSTSELEDLERAGKLVEKYKAAKEEQDAATDEIKANRKRKKQLDRELEPLGDTGGKGSEDYKALSKQVTEKFEERDALEKDYARLVKKRALLAKDTRRAETAMVTEADKIGRNLDDINGSRRVALTQLAQGTRLSQMEKDDRATALLAVQTIVRHQAGLAEGVEKELNEAGKRADKIRELNKVQDTAAIETKQSAKIVEGMVKSMEELLNNIERLGGVIGRSSKSQHAKAVLDSYEAQEGFFLSMGRINKHVRNTIQATNVVMQENLNDYTESLEGFSRLSGILDDKSGAKLVESVQTGLVKQVQEMAKGFDGLKGRLEGAGVDDATVKGMQDSLSNVAAASETFKKKFAEANKKLVAAKAMEEGPERKKAVAAAEAEGQKAADDFRASLLALKDQMAAIPFEANRKRFGAMIDEMLEMAASPAKAMENVRSKTELKRLDVEAQFGGIMEYMTKNMRMLGAAGEKAGESIEYQAAEKMGDAAEAAVDLGSFMGDLGQIVGGTNNTIHAAGKAHEFMKKVLEEERKAIPQQIDNMVSKLNAAADNMVKEALAKGDKAAIATAKERAGQLKATAQIVATQGRQLAMKRNEENMAKAELRYKQAVVDAAKKELEGKNASLDVEQERIDEEISFLEEMGGSYGQILDLQQQSIQKEAEKLQNMRNMFKRIASEFPKESLQYKQAELELAKAEYALERKRLGAQRDAYEKLVGLAFGGLRAARGARRRLDSDARHFGRGRVVSREGFALDTRGAGAKTLEERRALFTRAAEKGRQSAVEKTLAAGAKRGAPETLGRGKPAGEKEKTPAIPTGKKESVPIAAGGTRTGGIGEKEAGRLGVQPTAAEEKKTEVSVGVKGEVQVKFNNKMFQDIVVKIVADNINNAQIQNGMKKAGYVRAT